MAKGFCLLVQEYLWWTLNPWKPWQPVYCNMRTLVSQNRVLLLIGFGIRHSSVETVDFAKKNLLPFYHIFTPKRQVKQQQQKRQTCTHPKLIIFSVDEIFPLSILCWFVPEKERQTICEFKSTCREKLRCEVSSFLFEKDFSFAWMGWGVGGQLDGTKYKSHPHSSLMSDNWLETPLYAKDKRPCSVAPTDTFVFLPFCHIWSLIRFCDWFNIWSPLQSTIISLRSSHGR